MAPAEVAEPDLDETHNGRPVMAPADIAEPDTQNEWPLMAPADVAEPDLNHKKNEATEPTLSQLG